MAVGFFFRTYNLNWDQGYHQHPDERAIVMTVSALKFPSSFANFFSPESSWNPHFFAYGSLPFYLLRMTGDLIGYFDQAFAYYDKINLVGRVISAIADIGTLLLIYLFGKKLFNRTVGVLGAFLYAISVLPIQLSHFYAVDTLLTFFIILTLYSLIRFYENPTIVRSLTLGLFFGAALATKISATVLLAAIGSALTADFLLIFIKAPHKPTHWFPHLPRFLKDLISDGIVLALTTVGAFIFFAPYAAIDFNNFWRQTIEQSHMTKSAFTFPYTLQYVGKAPYIYELKNIFFWGLGPAQATLAFLGALYFTFLASRKYIHLGNNHDSSEVEKRRAKEIILVVFFWTYFFVVGKFAIGFMRYMLPLYPLLCLFAAVFIYRLHYLVRQYIKTKLFFIFHFSFLILILVWPLSFMSIYDKPNTRTTATQWIHKNIPDGSTLALEHWDDALPIKGIEKYKIKSLSLYDPDTQEKWNRINQQLVQTDYIIIASNRLSTPLQKLTNCEKLPPDRCYKKTAEYYKKLFNGALGFAKTAEFTNYPTFPFTNLQVNDQNADESFTVYDHPKIIIFKRGK